MLGSNLKKLWTSVTKKTPADVPALPEIPNKPPNALYLMWLLWRQKIDKTKWYSLLVTVPMIVFLSISGIVAWVAILGGFFWRLFKAIAT